jgi:hypothetical protein
MKEDFLTAHEWFMYEQAQWWEDFKQQEEARRMLQEGEWVQLELPLKHPPMEDRTNKLDV